MDERIEGLPVNGYRDQPTAAIDAVNGFKAMEENILRVLDKMQGDGTYDQRWLAIGRTDLERAFMAINRSVFRPMRANI